MESNTELLNLEKKKIELFNKIGRRKKEMSKELFTQKEIFETPQINDKLFDLSPSLEAGQSTLQELKDEYKIISRIIADIKESIRQSKKWKQSSIK